MLYKPDYKYRKGKEALENLKGEEADLIRYYVSEKDKYNKKLKDKVSEMQEVFNGIKKFTT